jgi:hypothetical protein
VRWGREHEEGQSEIDRNPKVKPKDVVFPETISLAFALCTKKCGAREFIVDGSTQRYQYCGRIMFRTEVAEYRLKKTKTPTKKSTVRLRRP